MSKKIIYVIAAILLVFIITNPTLNDFKDYLGTGNIKGNNLSRDANYLLFSKYSDVDHSYIGILKNFYKTADKDLPEMPTSVADSTKARDSALMADSARMAADSNFKK